MKTRLKSQDTFIDWKMGISLPTHTNKTEKINPVVEEGRKLLRRSNLPWVTV